MLSHAWLCGPMDCSPPGSSVHEIFQARILEWVAISFSKGSSQPRDRTLVSCTAGGSFTNWATREALRANIGVKLIIRYLPFRDSSVCYHWLFKLTTTLKNQRWNKVSEGGSVFWGGMRSTFFNALILNWKWHGLLKQLFSASSPGAFGGSRDHYQGFFKIKTIFILILRHPLLFFPSLSLTRMQ